MTKTARIGLLSLSELRDVLNDARQWVEANTAQVRLISPIAAQPGEAMLNRIDLAVNELTREIASR